MRINPRKRQEGVIFLALALILVVGGGSFALNALNNRQGAYNAQQAELHLQMEIAKANLLAYVANTNSFFANTRGPGFFPCPDTDADGVAEDSCDPTNTSTTVCGSTANRPQPQLGRLPRYVEESGYRMELSDYYKDPHQQFWYVVAPRYVYHSSNTTIRRGRTRTSTSETQTSPSPPPACVRLLLDDVAGYVAFIIAPGDELDTQDRAGSSTLYSNYLDGQNGANSYYYYTSYDSNPAQFNDQIIGITLDEYVKVVGLRVAIEIQKEMDEYYPTHSNSYPTSTDFRLVVNDDIALGDGDHQWLTRTSTYSNWNGERWGGSGETTYSKTGADTATINFSGCTGIQFQLTYPGKIEAVGDSCP